MRRRTAGGRHRIVGLLPHLGVCQLPVPDPMVAAAKQLRFCYSGDSSLKSVLFVDYMYTYEVLVVEEKKKSSLGLVWMLAYLSDRLIISASQAYTSAATPASR